VLEELEIYHNENPLQQGVRRDELRHRIRAVFSITLLEGVLSRLMEHGKIELAGGEVKLASHEIVFSGGTDALADEILSILSGEPLSPPDLGKLSTQLDSGKGKILELLSALQKKGDVVKIDENIWMVSEGARIAREKVEGFLREREKATASELRELLNVSRKYAIPILEYLDRVGVTYRKGDYRYLKG
jgi:selenocysteine-specific elongation factor